MRAVRAEQEKNNNPLIIRKVYEEKRTERKIFLNQRKFETLFLKKKGKEDIMKL